MTTSWKYIVLATGALGLAGCATWNEEAGSQLDVSGTFGNATMHNMLAQSCYRSGKGGLKGGAVSDPLVVLDVAGRSFSTEQLAGRLSEWRMSGDNYSLLIGGPDGVEESVLRQAGLRWSLSPLTLPHPLVRVVLVEQLYRAWTITTGHPYHRS